MADKKITDLQLRSDVDEDVNLPADDGIQSYRVTAPQMRTFVLAQQTDPKSLFNYSLVGTVGSSALTIALKTANGNNPSPSNPVKFNFRSATIGDGDTDVVSHTSSLSTVISSGSTAGHLDGEDNYLYIYAINNAGAVELAWSSNPFWDEGKLWNTTAEGGAGAADSRAVLYSTTGRTGVAIRLIGRMKVNQSTAGTWASVPSEIALPPFYAPKTGLIAAIQITGTAGWSLNSRSLSDFSTGTNINAPTVIYNDLPGRVDTTDTDLPQIVLNDLPAGFYKVEFKFKQAHANNDVWCIGDGTTDGPFHGNDTSSHMSLVAFFRYTSKGNRTFRLRAYSDSGSITLYGGLGSLEWYINAAVERLGD
jgi:hypothetical protein